MKTPLSHSGCQVRNGRLKTGLSSGFITDLPQKEHRWELDVLVSRAEPWEKGALRDPSSMECTLEGAPEILV
jgi:hypothetical protein